jgi:glycosyltransferase involved in cell wall biosynthesis
MSNYSLKVSVLMTAYNREKYIGNAIESVLGQTFQNFELIIVDDSSTDSTVAIAKNYATLDNRISVYVNKFNIGDYNNRNKAVSFASGKYLKFVDADDLIYPHTLDLMVSAMEKFPDAAYGFCYYGVQNDLYPFPYQLIPSESYHLHFFKSGLFHAGPGGAIIRSDIFHAVGGFSGKRYVGDYELWLKLSALHNTVLFWPSLLWWRKHDQQENKYENLNIDATINRYLITVDSLNSCTCPFSPVEKRKALFNTNILYLRNCIIYFLHFKFSKSLKLLRFSLFPKYYIIFALFPFNRFKKIMNII